MSFVSTLHIVQSLGFYSGWGLCLELGFCKPSQHVSSCDTLYDIHCQTKITVLSIKGGPKNGTTLIFKIAQSNIYLF